LSYRSAANRSRRHVASPIHSVIPASAGPMDIMQWFIGVQVPDPITFVLSSQYLDRGNLYPRQATLLKLIFLRDDLFTDYDRKVIDEWVQNFKDTGNNGIQPDIYDRISYLKSRGYKWFREVLLAMGRRGGKGYICALAMAYVLWHYMAKGDPQTYYGIDRDKQITAMIFAGKKEQATKNLWGDLFNVITGSTCYSPYISKAQNENLTIYAPNDFVRMKTQADKGIYSIRDLATFDIVPKESTAMAGRGPASCIQGYDEAGHVTKTTAKADAQDVYDGATPSLDQFGLDAFICQPSSTWQMLGLFYDSCMQAQENEDGQPVYPSKLMLQLTSWDIYEDWQDAHEIDLFPAGFLGDLEEYGPADDGIVQELPRLPKLRGAIQAFDEEMQNLEKANPDTFAVERRSNWAAALGAYLNESKVRRIFDPWWDRPAHYGRSQLVPQEKGLLVTTYKAHGDPASVNCNFGFAVAHEERDSEGQLHAVFDVLKFWKPEDFPDHTMDYDVIMDWIHDNVVMKFHPEELTFDQFNSVATVQKEQKRIRATPNMPKRVNVFEKTATATLNWNRFETFKAAINMGLVHAPACDLGEAYDQARVELSFLQKPEGTNRVDHATTGPVQTKDLADCLVECTYVLLGEQMQNFLNRDLGSFGPRGALQGGVDPMERMSRGAEDPTQGLAGFLRSRGTPTGSRQPFARPGARGTGSGIRRR
jgi:hypothetical protein